MSSLHRSFSQSLSKISFSLSLLLLMLSFSLALQARPADWYLWQSKLEDKLLCSQTSPGEGWEKFSGPFADSRCEVLRKKLKPA